MEKVEAEIKGYVVPYDIPSENVNMLKEFARDSKEDKAKKRKFKDYVRAKRVQATYYLHSLGVLATNSTMFYSSSSGGLRRVLMSSCSCSRRHLVQKP